MACRLYGRTKLGGMYVSFIQVHLASKGYNIQCDMILNIRGPRRVPGSLTTVAEPETQPKMTYRRKKSHESKPVQGY